VAGRREADPSDDAGQPAAAVSENSMGHDLVEVRLRRLHALAGELVPVEHDRVHHRDARRIGATAGIGKG
jgi:azurin